MSAAKKGSAAKASTPLGRLLAERELGVPDLMKEFGVSADTAHRWISGGGMPSGRLVALADWLGCSTDAVLGRPAPAKKGGRR